MQFPALLSIDTVEFPDSKTALQDPNGLLAIGGDLSPERLLHAYRQGIFPWFNEGDPICWWSPNPRMILPLEDFHIPKNVRKIRKQFEITINHDFAGVMHYCAITREEGTWITDAMMHAYSQLHQLGHAHSIEAYQDQQLVGGLYGISVGKVFCGESMFHLLSNASNAALAYLGEWLISKGFDFIDVQLPTEHFRRFGAIEVSREVFIKRLQLANK